MVKRFCFLSFLCCLFFITGCSSKNLSCTRDRDYNSDINIHNALNVKFKNDHVSKLDFGINVVLGESYPDSKDSLIENIKDEFKELSDSKGVTYSIHDNADGFDFNLKINFNKLDDTSKKKVDIINYEKSYDSIKSELEDVGYICK